MKNVMYTLVLVFCATIVNAQIATVSGTITDSSGLPLPGVNIIVKGTTNGTQSDFDGNYIISASLGNILVYSYVGFNKQQFEVLKNQQIIDVQMEEGATLHEVVVTGYGGTTVGKLKRKLGYSVSSLISGNGSGRNKKSSHREQKRIAHSSGATGAGTHFTIRDSNITETESYSRIQENIFKNVATAPLSTFSIDVDKAGYSNVRRIINSGQEIPSDAVKIEEMINYFNYQYPEPQKDQPFSISTEVSNAPWNTDAKLVRIGLKGKDITKNISEIPASNLVFLLDVSGSMNNQNKLPLLKSALRVLVANLRKEDKVSIVVYAGAAGLVLPATSGSSKEQILDAISRLNAGGSTAGGAGIDLAYKIAAENFIENGNNRVILATDGDFNVGASSNRSMEDMIVEKRKSGVFLTTLGFGMGNYKDSKMETLADKGNGNYAYIDTRQEARKVLGTEFFGTMYTIAKDVKIQVEFNPNVVQAYRLIGYENRLLNDEDFKDDTKDAGELGSGHTVTALYEVIPVGVKSMYVKDISDLKYTRPSVSGNTTDLLTVKFRYKEPQGTTSKLIEKVLANKTISMEHMSEDFKFSAAVALFGMQLRKSLFTNTFKREDVIRLAQEGIGADKEGYRAAFVRLVKSAQYSSL
jgi:Ca-activated chloride channel family protein